MILRGGAPCPLHGAGEQYPRAPWGWHCFRCNDRNVCRRHWMPPSRPPPPPRGQDHPWVRNTAVYNPQSPVLGSRAVTGCGWPGAPRLSVRYSPVGRSREGGPVVLTTHSQGEGGVQGKKDNPGSVEATKPKFPKCPGALERLARKRASLPSFRNTGLENHVVSFQDLSMNITN